MRESRLEEELEQAEEVYDYLVQTRRSLGTMLAETIHKGMDLEEFRHHLRDLPLLIQQADLRRTELSHELLDRRAMGGGAREPATPPRTQQGGRAAGDTNTCSRR